MPAGVPAGVPASVRVVGSLLQYLLPAHDYRARLQACTTALLAAVVQHSSLRGQLPPQSVLTISDALILVSYSIIFVGGCVRRCGGLGLGGAYALRFSAVCRPA